jgi:hypothetical protein
MPPDRTATPESVWSKGHPVPDRDPAEYRADDFGAVMRFKSFGDRHSEYGWEIVRVGAMRRGAGWGSGLRPINCRNNVGVERGRAID